jgi:hypothetical protein
MAVGLRTWISRRELIGKPLPPSRWLGIQIAAWALLEGAVLLSLVFLLLTGRPLPYAIPAGVAFLVEISLFPMAPPRETDSERFATPESAGNRQGVEDASSLRGRSSQPPRLRAMHCRRQRRG